MHKKSEGTNYEAIYLLFTNRDTACKPHWQIQNQNNLDQNGGRWIMTTTRPTQQHRSTGILPCFTYSAKMVGALPKKKGAYFYGDPGVSSAATDASAQSPFNLPLVTGERNWRVLCKDRYEIESNLYNFRPHRVL